jgi:hypothetical protein
MAALADMIVNDLEANFPPEIAHPLAALRSRTAQLLLGMAQRRTFPDGSRGYLATAQTTIEVVVGTKHDDPKALRERFEFPVSQFEIKVHDPVQTLNGAIRLDLEIKNYRAETISKVLFPGQTVALGIGRAFNVNLPPSLGRLEIPLSTDFGRETVRSRQLIFLAVETPIGTLHNPDAARMHALVNKVPPVGTMYVQEGLVPMANERGEVVAIKTMTETQIVELLPES